MYTRQMKLLSFNQLNERKMFQNSMDLIEMEETGKYNKEQLKNHQNLWLEQAVYKFEWEK